MMIEQRIQEMESKLIKLVSEVNIHSKEEAVRLLEVFGLDNESATKLLVTFRNAENAKNATKNVWDTALDSKVGNDNEIAQYQQEEYETRQEFDLVNAKCAWLMLTRSIEPRAINDAVLEKLYEYQIEESQIVNPALRISFHYYCESKAKDVEILKVKRFAMKIGKKAAPLRDRIIELEKQNQEIRNSYQNLQVKSTQKDIIHEEHYQAALVQISILKNKLKRLQDRGVFQTIKAKLFGNKTKELPEATVILPKTLRNSVTENVETMPKVESIEKNSQKKVEKDGLDR